MLKIFRKVCHDIFSEKNCKHYDITRILGFFGFIVYNIITLIHSFHHCYDFDPINYSMGLSIILATISAGVTYKYMKED